MSDLVTVSQSNFVSQCQSVRLIQSFRLLKLSFYFQCLLGSFFLSSLKVSESLILKIKRSVTILSCVNYLYLISFHYWMFDALVIILSAWKNQVWLIKLRNRSKMEDRHWQMNIIPEWCIDQSFFHQVQPRETQEYRCCTISTSQQAEIIKYYRHRQLLQNYNFVCFCIRRGNFPLLGLDPPPSMYSEIRPFFVKIVFYPLKKSQMNIKFSK